MSWSHDENCQFASVLAGLWKSDMTEEKMKSYLQALSKFSLGSVLKAMRQLHQRQDRPFMPQPAKIAAEARELEPQRELNDLDRQLWKAGIARRRIQSHTRRFWIVTEHALFECDNDGKIVNCGKCLPISDLDDATRVRLANDIVSQGGPVRTEELRDIAYCAQAARQLEKRALEQSLGPGDDNSQQERI